MSSSGDMETSLAARIATAGMAPKAKHAMVLKECMMDGVSRARGVRRARAMPSLEALVINNLN